MKRITKRIIFGVIMFVALAMPTTAHAENLREGVWEYSVYSAEATIKGYYGSSKEIAIPSFLGGYHVTAIDSEVFKETDITSLTIPAEIENIGYRAFADCKFLQTIQFNATNCSVADNVFRNVGKFSNILEVNFGDTVANIPNGIFANTEENHSHITSVIISDSVQKIGRSAFENCTDLKNVVWGNSIQEIEDSAFKNCVILQKVVIPECTEIIGVSAFNSCKNLNQVNYNAIDCAVKRYDISCTFFNESGKFSDSMSIIVGSKVKTIPCYLFYGSYATSVAIPDSVLEIGVHSFAYCEKLREVTVTSKTIKYLDSNIGWYSPFPNCSKDMLFKCYRNSTTAVYAQNNGFRISYIDPQIPISACSVKLNCVKYIYNGKMRKPSVTVIHSGQSLCNGTDYIVTYKNNKKVGTAVAVITGKGNYTGTAEVSYIITPKGTIIQKLVSMRKKIQVTIKKQTKETSGYEIRYSKKRNMKSAKRIVIKRSRITKKNIKKLSSKKTYYMQVRTFKDVKGKRYYSAWSGIKMTRVN